MPDAAPVRWSDLMFADGAEPPAVVRFRFEAPVDHGLPVGWRSDLVWVLRAFNGCRHADDVVLAAAELVSNGVEHGGGVRGMRVTGREGLVTIEVEDHRPSLTPPQGVVASDEGGRGLQIVDEVADLWGWWPTDAGKTVWATFLPAA